MRLNAMELEWCIPEETAKFSRYYIQQRKKGVRYGEPDEFWTDWHDAPIDLNYNGGTPLQEVAEAYFDRLESAYDENVRWRIVRRTATVTTEVIAE